jgi:RNA polymerase sigma-B factor
MGIRAGQVQLRAAGFIKAERIGTFVAANPSSEYAFVTDMFRHLQKLDETSAEYRRQREQIFEQCLPLADHIARRFRNRGEPLDDLVQAARVGLVNAVNRFDVDNGADFLGFAVPTIMGEVRRHFRDFGWAVKVPRRLKELQVQVNRAREELFQQVGRAPTASELAEHLGIDREAVVESTIAGSNYSTLSTDMHTGSQEGDQTIADTLGDVDLNLEKVLDLHTVRPLIAALSDREQTVLTLRFFENMTQSEIADRIGCSQMHVSRLLAKALHKLRRQTREREIQPRKRELAVSA